MWAVLAKCVYNFHNRNRNATQSNTIVRHSQHELHTHTTIRYYTGYNNSHLKTVSSSPAFSYPLLQLPFIMSKKTQQHTCISPPTPLKPLPLPCAPALLLTLPAYVVADAPADAAT